MKLTHCRLANRLIARRCAPYAASSAAQAPEQEPHLLSERANSPQVNPEVKAVPEHKGLVVHTSRGSETRSYRKRSLGRRVERYRVEADNRQEKREVHAREQHCCCRGDELLTGDAPRLPRLVLDSSFCLFNYLNKLCIYNLKYCPFINFILVTVNRISKNTVFNTKLLTFV